MRQLMTEVGGSTDEDRVMAALQEVSRRNAFERVLPLLVGRGRYETYDDAQAFMRMCLETARFDVLARSLARRPDAVRLRRPPLPRTPTSELLNESAPLGEGA